MAELVIQGLVKDGEIQTLVELDSTIEHVRGTYANAAKELAKGLKINVEGVADLEKINSIYVTQSKNASSASTELVDALKKQSEISQTVTKRIEERLNAEKLSTAEIKKLTKASVDNAASLEKSAKAEANLTKAQNAGNTVRKKTALTEEERLKLIRAAITLSNQEIHSKAQAKEVNKQLQKAVDVLKDTDENYIRTLARLNSTIGINSDYVKRNSDRYSQQKMTVGAYREEIKAAASDILKGNVPLEKMGDLAKSTGGYLRSSMGAGLSEVRVGVGSMIKGMVGVQAVISGIVAMFTKLREGVGSIVQFEFANSNLAAILGTTSDKIKELTTDAQRLGATTKYTASEATELQIELAKLGFTRKEILNATESVLRFAQATGAELGDAAALSGAALRMFNANTRETERYVSAMAVATSRSALSFSYLATSLPIVGPVAKAFNFTIEDTLALLGKLSDAGFDASMSATATRNILLNLADSSGKLAQALGKPVKTLPELVSGLQTLKDKGIDLNTTLELTDKRSVAAFNAFLTASDKIVPLRDQITGVTGELNDMADTMSDNVKGAVAGLDSAWEAFMLSFYSSKGVMKDVLNFLSKGIRDVANQLKSYSQLQDETDNTAISRAQKEMASSDILQKNQERMVRLYKEKLKEGMSADEAAISAKEEYIETLKSQLDGENRAYADAINKREEEEKKLSIKGRWYVPWWLRPVADKGIKEQIGSLKTAAAGKKAIASITESIIEDLNNVDLKQAQTSGKTTIILTDKEKRELEKAEREKQKIKQAYQDSELTLMDEGLEKELARIGIEYSKKIAAVKGNSKEEIATRKNLAKEMQNRLDEFSINYNSDREKKDVENALTVVQKGTKEELDLKLRQLEFQREAEIDAANKSGEDVFLINEKYLKKKHELYEKHASDQILLIADNAAAEQVLRDRQYQEDMAAAEKQYADDIKFGKDRVEAKRDYEEQKYQITLDYARKTTEAAIDALELELNTENLSAEDRVKIAEKLQDLKADLAKKEAEAEIKHIEDVTKADDNARKKRIKNVQKWLQIASRGIGAIGDLVKGVYDGQIDKIENEQDANDDAYDRNIERIENLAERGAITEEEAEARKRAAKAATEAKNEELAKKKAEIEHKQAVWDKATSVAQAGIATALAITQVLPNFVLAAIVGAIGALQVATILATPIPSYAEGTRDKSHPGGKALVGDAGKHEVVMHSGKAWITPDTPTIVDIPKGAQVFPDVDAMDFPIWDYHTFSPTILGATNSSPKTVVINDYTRLEKKTDRTNYLLALSIKQQRRNAYMCENEVYKKTIL